MTRVLRIDSSARTEGSVSRALSATLAADLAGPRGAVVIRDLAATPPPFVDEPWVGANFTAPDDRSDAQAAVLAPSENLVEELEAADQIVIGVPMYNFSIPASLKAWIDMVVRARRTFRYSQSGPEGFITGKTAWLVVASGGTALGSEIDFATPYLKFILGFIGLTDVRVIDATRWGSLSEEEQAAVRAKTGAPRSAA